MPEARVARDASDCAAVQRRQRGLAVRDTKSNRVYANLAQLTTFFATMDSAPFDDVAAEHYGPRRAQLEAIGAPIGANEMMIAATALAVGATLVTGIQREFLPSPDCAVESW
jgi:tRNA(fMet)-specific endonuclease VapC